MGMFVEGAERAAVDVLEGRLEAAIGVGTDSSPWPISATGHRMAAGGRSTKKKARRSGPDMVAGCGDRI
jgi:hypothetical protein